MSWLNRVALGLPTAAATVEEAHRNLMLTKALDLSAKRKQPVKLPLDPDRCEGGGVNFYFCANRRAARRQAVSPTQLPLASFTANRFSTIGRR